MRAKGKVIEYNVETKELKEYEQEFEFPDVLPVKKEGTNLDEVREMLEWYKTQIKPTLK